MRFRNASGERIRLDSGARMNDDECCCGLTCADDIVAYVVSNGFFVTIPESDPIPGSDCNCLCSLLPSGTYELEYRSSNVWDYPAYPGQLTTSCEDCEVDISIYGEIGCNGDQPYVCVSITGITGGGQFLMWGEQYADGVLPTSGSLPESFQCANFTPTGPNPCAVGGELTYSLG